jgi:alkyldihydroxyacetonephosphate synthase
MDKEQLNALKELMGDRVILENDSLDAHRFDRWCIKHYRAWQQQTINRPACIVRPIQTKDVQTLMAFAHKQKLSVVPFGLGSGVCGGIEPSDQDILIDIGGMNKICEINSVDLLATFESGVNGLIAEEAVAKHDLTIGHWPQSIAISSVGGWVSTRASGQFSTAYGNIEDIIYAIEVVLPNGERVTLGKAPRAAAGPDLRHLFVGAEGTMGIVTKVTLSLRRQPEKRAFSVFHTPSMQQGFSLQRNIVQADWRPPVMRQYDASEVARLFPDFTLNDNGLLLLVHEGPASRVDAEVEAVAKLANKLGIKSIDTTAAEQWLERRNHVPEWQDLFNMGWIADTIEISGTWQQIGVIYDNVIAALKTVPFIINASAHSSHVYRSGINLYFTFACKPENVADMEALYFKCWDKAINATVDAGGGIAHHHGVGRLRKPYLGRELGEGGVNLLRSIKHAIDPHGLMNPGNLIPE